MARVGNEIDLVPSVLDRLLDDEPENHQQEPLATRYQRVSQLKKTVARDLEALLNARQEALKELPPEFTELRGSLLVYGLPDFIALSLLDQQHRHRIRRALEQAIAHFEPRLDRVRVSLEESNNTDRGLHFRIEGILRVEPAPEMVSFDAVLQLNTQAYIIQGQG